jgi:hypothetical protein
MVANARILKSLQLLHESERLLGRTTLSVLGRIKTSVRERQKIGLRHCGT